MELLENLSDNEIRMKLAEYGHPVGPITQTTKKILLKKLGLLIKDGKSAKSVRRDKFMLSSADESGSEHDDYGSGRQKRNSMPPPSSVRSRRSASSRNNTLNSTLHDFSPVSSPVSFNKLAAPSRTTQMMDPLISPRVSNYDFDTGSDTDGGASTLNRRSSRGSSSFRKPSSSKTSTPLPQLSSARKESRPFLSNLTRRLGRQTNEMNPQDIKETDVDEGPSYPTPPVSSYRSYPSSVSSLYGRPPVVEESGWKQQLVARGPMLLLSLFGLFILWIVGTYTVRVYQQRPLVSGKDVYPLCNARDIGHARCIPRDEFQLSVSLYRDVHQLLLSKATQSVCGPKLEDGSFVRPYMTEREIVQFLLKTRPKDVPFIEDGVKNLGLLLLANPHWGITVIRQDVNPSPAALNNVPDNAKAVPSDLGHGSLLFITPWPDISWTCRLKMTAYTFISYVSMLLFVGGSCYACFVGFRFYTRTSQEKEEEVMQMVVQILKHVTDSCTGDTEYVAIRHVHDTLIPPAERTSKAEIWRRAVDFIEKNESRFRREIQIVWGEEMQVWKPLRQPKPSPPPKPTNSTENHLYPDLSSVAAREGQRVWQGEAFETSEGSMNSLPVSPTPCLKIRHMFQSNKNYGTNWEQAVKDAILERCEGARLLHINVDSRSKEGCVYVKCASSKDAGIAYRRLHGSWFDGSLVTVKYIRLERYNERYPDSISCKSPLSPSNNLRLSLGGYS